MAAQNLLTNIVINARAGNGFSQLGNTLTEMGSMVNGISQQLINFGKESITVYRNYEKSMADAEVALSTKYGRGTAELLDVMNQLDVAATNWAATTIFHTNDVGNAIAEAAHAGWNFDQIMAGLPAAMQLAQAGSIDLSEAVNYIVKATDAAGIGFEDVGNFIDLWAYAANSSATNIDEIGMAMLRMGSTMRFAGSTEELMTLIAVTANAGSVGSEAGTMIRNSMLRLIAPTQKAKKAMAQLGATSDETAVLMNDASLAAANAELAAHGFSAFYQEGSNKGQMKNVLDIYRELYVALGDIAGGYDNIGRNETALEVISSIFPTRTITEALTLLRGAAEGYDGLYESMMGGDAAGYGEYAAITMMDTLDGKIETFESKVERLKQLVGEELSGDVESVLGSLGSIVDKIAELPEDQFDALVAGLKAIALTGPGLLLAGGAFRLIGLALTPAGGIGLGLTALVTATAAIKELEEADFASNFGNMELDTTSITSFVQGLGADFKEAYTQVNNFQEALGLSVENYQKASSTFSSTLFTNMITNSTLGEKEIEKLKSLGQDMFLAVQGAITSSAAASMSYWNMLFGGEGNAEYDPAYQQIIDLTNQAYEEAMLEAQGIGQGLRDAMTKAFADGEVSEEEYQRIMSFMRAYNDAIARAAAEAQNEENYIQMNKWLRQAQTASIDEIKDIATTAATERDAILASQQEAFENEYYRLMYRGADAETLARAEAKYKAEQQKTSAAYDEFLITLWNSQIQQGGQADNFGILAGYAGQYLSGNITAQTALDLIYAKMGGSNYSDTGGGTNTDRAQLGRMMGYMIASLGGESGVADSISYYEKTGNAEMAQRLRSLLAMEQLVNGFSTVQITDNPIISFLTGSDFHTSGEHDENTGAGIHKASEYNRNIAMMEGLRSQYYDLGTARETIDYLGDGAKTIAGLMETIGKVVNGDEDPWRIPDYALSGIASKEFTRLWEQIAATYDLEAVAKSMGGEYAQSGLSNYFALWDLLYGQASKNPDQYRLPVTPEIVPGATEGMGPVVIPIQPKQEGADSMMALQEQGVTVEVGADSTELQATIEAEDGQTLTEYLRGDATELQLTIWAEDGHVLEQNVTGDATRLAEIIESYNGKTITVNIKGNKLFASGGRATSASIFGEAGAEWAIPEAHTERTAELLNAARAASGFTWPDLLARFGGLNANAKNTPTTLIYSPTINAQDATGVEQVLRDDKARLDKWYEEKKLHDEVEVYA